MLAFIKNIVTQSQREEGQGMAEYALVVGLIALIVMAGVTLLGTNLLAEFNSIAGNF